MKTKYIIASLPAVAVLMLWVASVDDGCYWLLSILFTNYSFAVSNGKFEYTVSSITSSYAEPRISISIWVIFVASLIPLALVLIKRANAKVK